MKEARGTRLYGSHGSIATMVSLDLAHINGPAPIEGVPELGSSGTQHLLITNILAVFLFFWYLFIIGLTFLGVYTVKTKNTHCDTPFKFHTPVASTAGSSDEGTPGVTILRPLKGIDSEFEHCLSSAFLQEYPVFQIIFCIGSSDDPAIEVVNNLMRRYPDVDAQLIIGDDHYGPNPKINNLVKGYKAAKYDILWVLDSNVWAPKYALARSVTEFQKNSKIRLVHHLPLAVSTTAEVSKDWGSKLDEMFLFTSHSKFYSAINKLAVSACVTGKSNLYRRSDLDSTVVTYESTRDVSRIEHFGLQTFACYIAEDNMIAEAIWKFGGRTAMSSDTVIQPLADVPLKGYISRRVRWLRVRKYMVLAATLVEPTTESLICGLLGAWSIVILFSSTSSFNWTYFLFHMIAWCAIDYWHFHNLLAFSNIEHDSATPYFAFPYFNPANPGPPSKRPLTSWLPAWLLRELLAFPIWVIAMCGHRIYWRNRPFRIKSDLSVEEIMER